MAGSTTIAKAAAPENGSRGSTMWIQGLACGACLAFAAPTVLLVSVLLAPALICFLVYSGAERGILRAVAMSCAAASLSPVWHLWLSGDHLEQAVSSMSEPFVLLLAWGAGASAWALCQVIPVILSGSWDMRSAARIRTLEAELKALHEEWVIDGDAKPQQ